MSFETLLAPRIDRANRLYDSCVQVLTDAYKQYEKLKKMRDDLMNEKPAKEIEAHHQELLRKVTAAVSISEDYVKRSIVNLENATEMKTFLESLADAS